MLIGRVSQFTPQPDGPRKALQQRTERRPHRGDVVGAWRSSMLAAIAFVEGNKSKTHAARQG
jgi:hypothetical protein